MTDLIPEWRVGDVVLTEYPFSVPIDDTVDYGGPESVTEVIRSMFLDGDFEVSSKSGNRTLVLPVLIADADMAALADAEALLAAECDKARNEVYVDPGDEWGEPFIFDVFPNQGSLRFNRSDKYEKNGFRAYMLTFRALPFSRSAGQAALAPTPTSIGTARQKSYSFTAEGSARTETSLHVAGAVGGLGATLIYTRPGAQGMIPLRQHRTSAGATTADANRVSGTYDNNIAIDSAAFVAEAPKDEVPDGTYILLGLLALASGTGDTTISVAVDTRVDGYATRASGLSWSVAHEDLSTSYEIRQLTTSFRLPNSAVVDPASATVRIQIFDESGGVTVRLDEVWLVEVGSGALTWPETGVMSGGMPPAAHIWADPASVTQPCPRVLRGSASDQSDAFAADVYSWGTHILEPGENHAFLVTASDTTSALDLAYWRRHHTHGRS